MELNIHDPLAPSFNQSIGITDQRANQLAKGMDNLVKDWDSQTVRACDVFNEIAHLCDNNEELVWCTMVHMEYRSRMGYPYIVYK